MDKNKKVEMFRHNDYRHLMQVRAIPQEESGKMIIRGKAISFDDPTVLFEYDGVEYKEIIAKGALDEADLTKAFMKYNHSNNIMAMARYKNGTLKIDTETGEIEADLADTTAGRDLFTLVKRGDIDKMSFAFTIREESYDKTTHTWTVRKIDKLYDVAAVEVPAYENTELFARRYGEVEASRVAEVEASEKAKVEAEAKARQRQVEIIRLRINNKKKEGA